LGRLLAALVVACAAVPRADARQAKAFDFAELEKVIEAELKEGRTPGAAVAVVVVGGELPKPQFYLPGEERAFYGCGLLGFESGGVRVVSHGGVSSGYGSTIMFVPDASGAIEHIFMGLYAARRSQ
jgi:hypothetical protein